MTVAELDNGPGGKLLTPPEVAQLYRVTPEKVLTWIRSGELDAINVASRGARRPRFRIRPEALREFEAHRRRVCKIPPKSPKPRSPKRPAGWVDYF